MSIGRKLLSIFKKKTTDNNAGQFLLPKDKEAIAGIAMQEALLKAQEEQLEKQIMLVQKSTRTSLPFFMQFHNKLRMRYQWYYRWHLSPFASVVHWMTLAGFTIGFTAFSLVSLMNTNVGMTYASATNIDQDYLASDEAAATFSGSPSKMSVTLNDAAITKYKWAKSQGATLYFGLKGSVEDVANNYLAIAGGSGTRLNIDNGSEYAPLLIQEALPFDWQGGFQVDNSGNMTSMVMRVGQEWNGNVVRAVIGVDLSGVSITDPTSLVLELVDAEGAPYTGTVHATVFADDTPTTTYTGSQLFTQLGTSSVYTPPVASTANIDGNYVASDDVELAANQYTDIALNAYGLAKLEYCRTNSKDCYIGLKGDDESATIQIFMDNDPDTRPNILVNGASTIDPAVIVTVGGAMEFTTKTFYIDLNTSQAGSDYLEGYIGYDDLDGFESARQLLKFSSLGSTEITAAVLRVKAFTAPAGKTVHAVVLASDTPETDGDSTTHTALGTTNGHSVAETGHTITPSAGANGAISPDVATEVANAGSQDFIITASAGHYIAEIKIDGVSQTGSLTSPYSFTNVTADHTIAVTFAANNTCVWDGGDADDDNWSSADNWSANTVPSATCAVIFDNTSDDNSTIDASFSNHILSFSLNSGYDGTVTANNNLTVDGDLNLAAGTLKANSYTLNVGGIWNNTGGIFTADTSTVKMDNTGTKSVVPGNSNFYNLTTGNNAFNSINTGMTAYYKMDEASGTATVADSSGNNNTGTSTSLTNVAEGKYANARTFSGIDYNNITVNVPDNIISNSDDMSFGVWFKRTIAGISAYIFISNNDGGDGRFSVGIEADKLTMFIGKTTGNFALTGITDITDTTSWHHAAAVRQSGVWTLYLDGQYENSAATTNEINNTMDLKIGAHAAGTKPYVGSLDEARFYNKALTSTDINSLNVDTFPAAGGITLEGNLTVSNNLSLPYGTFVSGSNNITAGNFIQSGGTFTAPAAGSSFTVNGDWNHSAGTFNHNSGTVTLVGDASIQGDTTFYNLTHATPNKTIIVTAETTQTIANDLTITGTDADNKITLVSSSPGTGWNIAPTAGHITVAWVTVSDSTSSVAINATNSTEGTADSTTNWLPASAPTVSTQAGSDVADKTFTGNGTIADDGGAAISERGVYWASAASADCSAAADGTKVVGTETSPFTADITGLYGNNFYCYRAFGTNTVGTGYGDWVSVQTTAGITRTISDAGGNWDSTSTWREGLVPTSADDVVATATSGSIVINVAASLNNIDTTNYSGTLNVGSQTINVNGNWKWVGGTFTAGTSTINMNSTSTGKTLTSGGQTYYNITFNGIGGGWTLQDALTTNVWGTVTLARGALNTNGQTLLIGNFNSSNSNVRTLELGSSTITAHGAGGIGWNFGTSTNLTFQAGNSMIILPGSSTAFFGGGLAYNIVNLNGPGAAQILNGNSFASLIRTGTDTKADSLSFYANQTITGELVINGNSPLNRLLVNSNLLGTARIITAGSHSISNSDFRDITGAGAANWDLSAITGGSGDCGGNIGINFTPSTIQTWNGTAGNWSDSTKWTSRVPLPQDDVVFASFGEANRTVVSDMPRMGRSIDWSSANNNAVWNNTINTTLYGSLTFGSAMNLVMSGDIYFESRSAATLTSAGKNISKHITLQMIGGALTLMDDLAITGSTTFTIAKGTFDANDHNLSMYNFDSTGSGVRAINMGNGTWTISGAASTPWGVSSSALTLNAEGSTIILSNVSTGNKTFAGGAQTYNNLSITGGGTGTWTFTGSNSFNNFAINAPKTVTFTAGTTQTINGTFTATGTDGNIITLNSSTPGTPATLTKPSGYVYTDYSAVTDVNVTGGASWAYGANSTITTSTGWTAAAAPTITTEAASSIGDKTFTANANVTNGGGLDITGRGIYWVAAASADCSAAADGTQVTSGTGTGAFTADVSGLYGNNYYCYRGYATNLLGTSYGDWVSVQTTAGTTRTVSAAGGNFSDASTWIEGIAPTSVDDIYADANSGDLSTDISAVVRSFDFTNYIHTLALGSSSLTATGENNLSVNCILGSGMTITGTGTLRLSPTTTRTIDFYTNGLTIPVSMIINAGAGTGTANLRDNLLMVSDKTFTVTGGTFNTNNFAMNIGLFNSSNSNTRAVNLGSSNITIAYSGSASSAWDIATFTNLNLDTGSSTITFSGAEVYTQFGNKTYNNVVFTAATSSNLAANGYTPTFANLTVNGGADKTSVFVVGQPINVTETLTIDGNSVTNRLLVKSYTIGTPATVTAGTVSISNADFRDITGAGAANWNLSTATGGSGDAGGNTGITFTPASTQIWDGGTGSWSDITHWGNLRQNPGFENGIGLSSTGWTVPANDGTIEQTSVAEEIRSGTYASKFTAGASTNNFTYGSIATRPGRTYTVSFWSRGDGSNAGRYRLRDSSNGVDMVAATTTGITGTSYSQFATTFVAPENCYSVLLYLYAPAVNSAVAYFDDVAIYYDAARLSGRVPLPQDDVHFDATSIPTLGQTITADMPRLGKDIDWTGVTNTPTFALNTSINNTVYGSITLIADMVFTNSRSMYIEGRGAHTITSAGKSFTTIQFQAFGGTYTFQDAFTCGATIIFANGTLDAATNNVNVTTSVFNSTGAASRTIKMGTGIWKTTSTAAGNTWQVSASLTIDQVTNLGTINLANSSSNVRTFVGAGLAYNNITIDAGGVGAWAFTGANTFNNFTINAPKIVTFTADTTQTINGTFTAAGDADNAITINSSSAGSPATLTKSSGIVSGDYLSLQDITATGGASWYAGNNSTDVSGNSGWIFTKSPSAITLDTPQADGLTAHWTDNSSDETQFNVYVADGNDDCSAATYGETADFTADAGATSKAITGLGVNTRHCVKVTSVGPTGESIAAHAEAPKYTLANIPSISAAGDYDTTDNYHVDSVITPNLNPEGTNYYIRYSTDDTTYVAPAGMDWQTGTTYNLKKDNDNADLLANTQYYLKVKAKNGDGVETDYSTAAADVTPPAAPASLQTSNICSTTTLISWAAATGANSYNVSYGTDEAATNLGVINDITETSKSLSSLSDGLTYYWKVSATSTANGTGAYSAIESFETSACVAPLAPSDFNGTAASSTAINWAWSDSATNETGYKVQDTEDSDIATLEASSTNYSEGSLSINTVYTRHVNVYNFIGSNNSNQDTVYTLAAVPGTPTLAVTSSNSIRITLDQNGNPANTRFAIYNQTLDKYVKSADGSVQDAEDWQTYADWGGALGFINTGLTVDTNYIYKVKAQNGDSIATAFGDTANASTLKTFTITIGKDGNGDGTFDQTSPVTVDEGSTTTITATPAISSNFTSWEGCSSSPVDQASACVISNISENKSITATFTLKTYSLTINTAGNGAGQIAIGDNELEIPFVTSVDYGFSLTAVATPATSSNFTSWTGCDSTSGDQASACSLTNITANKSITATFTLKTYTVTIGKTGTGTGTFDQSSQSVNYGSNLTITAIPSSTSSFIAWTGCDSNPVDQTSVCELLNITSNKTPSAQFELKPTAILSVSNLTNPISNKTNKSNIELSITPNVTASEMKLANSMLDLNGSSYGAIEQAKAWTTTEGDGEKAIYLRVKDAYGNESAVITASIILDTTPTAKVTNLTATPGQTSVSLSWTNPTNADFTRVAIFRSTTPAFTPNLGTNKIGNTATKDEATYIDTTVENGITYYYQIKAIDDIDNYSLTSNEVSAKPDSDLPSTPGKPTISNRSNILCHSGLDPESNKEILKQVQDDNACNGTIVEYINKQDITISWAASTDVNSGLKSYILNIGTTSGTSDIIGKEILVSDLVDQNLPAYQLTSLSADGTYYARIQAKDNLDNLSSFSPELKFIVDTVAPEAPAGIVMFDASDRSKDIYAVALSWKSSSDTTSGLKGYQISRNNTPLVSEDDLTKVQTDEKTGISSYLDILSADATVSFSIKSTDLAGNSTDQISAKLADTEITKLTGQVANGTSIKLISSIIGEGKLELSDIEAKPSEVVGEKTQATISWKTSVPAGTEVRYGQSTEYNFNTEADLGLNSTHLVVLSDLLPNTTYHYQVISKDKYGDELLSDDQTFTTNKTVKENTVLEIIVDNVTESMNKIWSTIREIFARGNSVFAASLEEPNDISVVNISSNGKDSYAIYWPKSLGQVTIERSNDGETFVLIGDTSANFYLDYPPQNNSSYTYRIGKLVAKASDQLSGKPSISQISINEGVITNSQASLIVNFKTDKLANAQIFYGEGSDYAEKTELNPALNQSHTVLIEKLRPNTTYHLKMVAKSNTGEAVESEDQIFTIGPAPKEDTIFNIIFEALSQAFSGFNQWMKT